MKEQSKQNNQHSLKKSVLSQTTIHPTPSEDYTNFVRPVTGKLLQLLKIDIHYHGGQGNWLSYDKDHKSIEVFDATGGYGANLFGHKNPRLMRKALAAVVGGGPNHTQGSIRKSSAQLGALLNQMLTANIKQGPWITSLSNSGTEAVEAAIKHSLMFYEQQIAHTKIELQESENKLNQALQHIDPKEKKRIAEMIANQIPDLSSDKNLNAMLASISSQNHRILEAPPLFVALKEGFHGKTLGSLEVTYNPQLKQKQKHNTIFARKDSPEALEKDIRGHSWPIHFLSYDDNKIKVYTKEFNTIAAAIVEPIQGEAGIKEIDQEVLLKLRQIADQHKFLLIFDEIQAGLYRTGSFVNSAVPADIYCFSKALGGGFAKIAATVILKSKYIEMFGLLHTSTFAEDEFSSIIACEALKILQEDTNLSTRINLLGDYLKNKLELLANKYPTLIKETRGKGLFQAIEFSNSLRQRSYEMKLFCDIKMIGHLLSSALIHRQQIRMAPSLSNPYSLRIEPSIYTTTDEIDYLINGLDKMAAAIQNSDSNYFFGHLFPEIQLKNLTRLKQPLNYAPSKRPVAVFLNHLIDTANAKKLVQAFENVSDKEIDGILDTIFDLVEFEIYDRKIIKGTNNHEIEIIMLSIPLTSKLILRKNSPKLIQKIQNAIHYAKNLGAITVGLGQFTSIVSKNGTKLDPMGMNLTTGNAYTIALSVEAALKISNQKINHLGCIGAAGNIVSTATTMLADYASKITLFYHTELEKSIKLQQSVKGILETIAQTPNSSYIARKLQPLIPNGKITNTKDLFTIIDKIKPFFGIETNLSLLKQCDLIYSGTNSQKPFIGKEYIAPNTTIVDVGVPANVKKELYQNNDNIQIISGGLAKLPRPYNNKIQIDIPAFPLKAGEAFACMAETFLLSLAKNQNTLHIGEQSKERCKYITELAREVGFSLGDFKIIKSL